MCALVVLCIGLWSTFYRHTYVALLTASVYPSLPLLLVGVGFAATFVVILGCVAGCNENKCAALSVSFFSVDL